jgi:hypothetical protein
VPVLPLFPLPVVLPLPVTAPPPVTVPPPAPEVLVFPAEPEFRLHTPLEQNSLSVQQVLPQTLGADTGQPTHSPSTHCSSFEQQFLPHRVGESSGHLKQPPREVLHVVPLGQQTSAPHRMAEPGQPQVPPCELTPV